MTESVPLIRDAAPSDAVALANLYNHYVINTVTTFETAPIVADEMASRVEAVELMVIEVDT